ncbi:type VI secretion system contractile sheath small subunit [Sulfitobacter sp. KE5]|uniref:type VI secretion system contractile sheath domain-containing protein n=1 Tax=Sulfitobacter sp. KE5 TaxID=2731157 RepID=UPI0023E0D369|nr:type VI secretion system contractile sheath large subunit [Sulfitobacter sp. KE5]MDF3416601.1 type VI secretion system contractile sheath small subunit [Sulfitobacter sp. KE5]
MAGKAQKFIHSNAAPRAHTAYELALYEPVKPAQLPFVLGVLSDLCDPAQIDARSIEDRGFFEIDVEGFSDLTDLDPNAKAARADTLRQLLVDRPEFADLLAYMDGATSDSVPEIDEQANALDALRAIKLPEPEEDTSGSVLDGLRTMAVPDSPTADDSAAALDALRTVEIGAEGGTLADDATEALDALRMAEQPEADTGPKADDILSNIEAIEVEEIEDTSDSILAELERVEDTPETDDIEATLAGLEAPEQVEEADDLDAILSDLDAPEAVETTPDATDVLATIEAVEEDAAEDTSDTILADLERVEDAPETDDIEATLAGLEAPEQVEEADDLDAILSDLDAPEAVETTPDATDVLATIEAVEENAAEGTSDTILADLERVEDAPETDDIEATLAGLEAPEQVEEADDLDAILSDLDAPEAVETMPDDLEALLDDLGGDDTAQAADEDVGDLLADVEPSAPDADPDTPALVDPVSEAPKVEAAPPALTEGTEPDAAEALAAEEEAQAALEMEAILADLQPDVPDEEDDDLDALLGALEEPQEEEPAPPAVDDLDALLAGLQDDMIEAEEDDTPEQSDAATTEPAPIVPQPDRVESEPSGDVTPETLHEEPAAQGDDLDALLDGLDTEVSEDKDAEAATAEEGKSDMPAETEVKTAKATLSAEPELAFGTMSGERPDAQKLERKRFRIALLGDFTGRAAHGLIEVGDTLAARKPIILDTDTVEDVIEGFATTLVLPIGKDGAGVEVKLGGLDDLHPDELYENVELFAALKGLKAQLGAGGTAENAAKSLVAWGEQHGRAVAPARATSGGNTVRADLKLSDFQQLIGDTQKTLAQPSPVDELMARVVGPHIRKLPDPDATAMAGAVDDALSGAMRMVLHHPEFQSVEAQWRALDLIARSVETDDTLEVVLYDISAEEIAADLTQSDDLSNSGLARLLTEGPMDEEFGRGAYSALIGMYTFEETPPHAQLLGRIARVAAHIDAPFFAAITPGFIETAKPDRHPLVAAEWDRLRAMPEARHLALATPRFLMRRPYGAKTEPIYEFDFEEFTQSAGLSGMLWGNPVVLVAILLARSFKENGPSMALGKIMSLGDMPYHFVLDRFGDQVALPCTERNLTLDKVETVLGRGYLPVVSIKGRDEIRLASFQSLGGGDILGPWSGEQPPPPSAPQPPKATSGGADGHDNDAAGDDDDLDDLLSGFDLDADDTDEDIIDDEHMDAELAALLADL